MAGMETGFEFSQEMRPWVSPSLIEANYILSLSQQELQNVIEAEMLQNPALELEDRSTCPVCDTVLEGNYCATCRANQNKSDLTESFDSMDDNIEPPVSNASLREDDPEFDPMTLIASNVSVIDQIHTDAHLALDEHEQVIADYLVESLDDRGFLTVPITEIAEQLGASAEHIVSVLEVVQDLSPVGVGARDLRECLLLQLDYLERIEMDIPANTRVIVDEHLAAFGAHKFGQIARSLGITVEELEDIRDFIREHLNPFPLQSDQAKSWRSPSESRFVAPDVVIDVRDDELVVEVVDNRFFHLRTNQLYDQMANQFTRKRGKKSLRDRIAERATAQEEENAINPADIEAIADASNDDKDHVRHYSNRAKMFMSNIQQRRDTLLRISECICQLQEGFLRGGVRELQPLTRALVAQQVGVHESTVSRATANKYVMLPNRKVIPFSDFFTPSLSTKDIIKEIIEREVQRGQPLTDRKICDLLLKDGIRVARRTVAKYRAELGILPSTMR